jgi:hypothetical protein
VVAAIVVLFILLGLLTAVVVLNMRDCATERSRLSAVNQNVYALHERLAALSNDAKSSHEALADRLWWRASDEVDQVIDQEIERARARGR